MSVLSTLAKLATSKAAATGGAAVLAVSGATVVAQAAVLPADDEVVAGTDDEAPLPTVDAGPHDDGGAREGEDLEEPVDAGSGDADGGSGDADEGSGDADDGDDPAEDGTVPDAATDEPADEDRRSARAVERHAELTGDPDLRPGDEGFGQAVSANARQRASDRAAERDRGRSAEAPRGRAEAGSSADVEEPAAEGRRDGAADQEGAATGRADEGKGKGKGKSDGEGPTS